VFWFVVADLEGFAEEFRPDVCLVFLGLFGCEREFGCEFEGGAVCDLVGDVLGVGAAFDPYARVRFMTFKYVLRARFSHSAAGRPKIEWLSVCAMAAFSWQRGGGAESGVG
jgi:hypothetical protein